MTEECSGHTFEKAKSVQKVYTLTEVLALYSQYYTEYELDYYDQPAAIANFEQFLKDKSND